MEERAWIKKYIDKYTHPKSLHNWVFLVYSSKLFIEYSYIFNGINIKRYFFFI